MTKKNLIADATFDGDVSSIIENTSVSDMYKYYQIYPKCEMPEFAIFYCLEDMAEELKIELEVILGIPLKFENVSDKFLTQKFSELDRKNVVLSWKHVA